jgi:hypothetical protein
MKVTAMTAYRRDRPPTGRPTGRPVIPHVGPETEKQCSKCGRIRPLSDYRRHGGNKKEFHPWCRACLNESNRIWALANPEKMALKNLRQRAFLLGVNRDEVAAYWKTHGGLCDVCGNPQSRANVRLDIEHDHETNEFRGLTCSDCNNIMKFARDDAGRLMQVIRYLANPPARSQRMTLF